MKVFRNQKLQHEVLDTYDLLLQQWQVPVQERDVDTFGGTTHVITCGNPDKPPLLLFHGVGDNSALMWLYNAKALSERFYLYAVDTIGGPGKSRPDAHYQKEFDQIRWIDELLTALNLDQVCMAGVSNGSYIVQHYGIMRPERVLRLVCMSGALSTEDSPSPMKAMLRVFLPEALFPTKGNVQRLIHKLAGRNSAAFTDNALVMRHYAALLKGFNTMSMACHPIHRFSPDQIQHLRGKSLFLIGDCDPLGDRATVQKQMTTYGMDVRFIPEAGHGLNHEMPEVVHPLLLEFLAEGDVHMT